MSGSMSGSGEVGGMYLAFMVVYWSMHMCPYLWALLCGSVCVGVYMSVHMEHECVSRYIVLSVYLLAHMEKQFKMCQSVQRSMV